ncbi:MAG: hypothetical protein H6739_21830 [Alphaproteobacteria bacterium]|nr:hypothetical protein [Alphaproteobacteria bacterium]
MFSLRLYALMGRAFAQDDPFAVLDDPGAAATVATTACDDIAAAAAAQNFHIFVAAVVVVTALSGLLTWWFLERKAVASWPLRWALGALDAGLIAGVLIYFNPFSTEAQRLMMADASCQHHFLMASTGPVGQGLVLGFLPAAVLALLLIFFGRRIL